MKVFESVDTAKQVTVRITPSALGRLRGLGGGVRLVVGGFSCAGAGFDLVMGVEREGDVVVVVEGIEVRFGDAERVLLAGSRVVIGFDEVLNGFRVEAVGSRRLCPS